MNNGQNGAATHVPEEKISRYEVTIQRKFIVYSTDPESAASKALASQGFTAKAIEGLPIRVLSVEMLPTVAEEKHPPIIDRAPSRESQK